MAAGCICDASGMVAHDPGAQHRTAWENEEWHAYEAESAQEVARDAKIAVCQLANALHIIQRFCLWVASLH